MVLQPSSAAKSTFFPWGQNNYVWHHKEVKLAHLKNAWCILLNEKSSKGLKVSLEGALGGIEYKEYAATMHRFIFLKKWAECFLHSWNLSNSQLKKQIWLSQNKEWCVIFVLKTLNTVWMPKSFIALSKNKEVCGQR